MAVRFVEQTQGEPFVEAHVLDPELLRVLERRVGDGFIVHPPAFGVFAETEARITFPGVDSELLYLGLHLSLVVRSLSCATDQERRQRAAQDAAVYPVPR